MGENTAKFVIFGVGAVILLAGILIGTSFSYVHYYQYGFFRRKSTGNVDTTEVYTTGRYAIGPDAEFKIFPADAQYESLKNIAVFTSDKLEIKITVHFQYFLRKNDLKLLHDKYNLGYKPIFRQSAQDALKGVTNKYKTNEFISERKELEKSLFDSVKNRLEGSCCIPGCTRVENLLNTCRTGCIETGCTAAEKGLFAEVRFFQLTDVGIPSDVKTKFMKALTLKEDSAKEVYLQEATLVEKDTDLKVKSIENTAAEIGANATAQAALTRSRATASYSAILETARINGLKSLYSGLGITSLDHMRSFDYLRTLKEMDKAHLAVDFSQLIVGPMSTKP